jgi:hypothetical protein
MSEIASLYEEPMVLSSSTGHRRIFAPVAYKMLREQMFVPTVIGESAQLARLFPICWKLTDAGPVLGCLRTLLGDGRGHAADAPITEALLPLILQAFPIIVPGADQIERQQLQFDAVIADKPTDIGAPLLMQNGQLSKAAMERARKAVAVARAMPDTAELTRDLHEAGLLEPWPLRFDLGSGRKVAIEDLLVISASRLHYEEVGGIVARHGALAGMFISLQRASLFRVAILLNAARQAVVGQATAGQAERGAGTATLST